MKSGVLAAALALLVFASLLPVVGNDFVNYDDDTYVTANPHLDGSGTSEFVRWAFTTFTAANWHPLTWLSHALDVALFGRDPRGHHFVGLLLHAANAVLLLLLLRSMTGALWPSAFVAGVFGVHPLHVESVAWVAERKDLLAALFLWLALLAYRRHLARRSAPRYLLVLLLHALGLAAKPMLVTVPVVLLLLDAWPLGRLRTRTSSESAGGPRESAARVLAEKLPFLALSLASVVVTFAAQARGGALKSLDEYPLPLRAGNATVSVVRYLALALWPSDLAVFYPHPGATLGAATVLAAAALVAAITVLALRAARRRPHLAAGWFWFLVTLSPVLGVVQVGAQAMADRYTYVPLTGVTIAAAWGAAALTRRHRRARALTGVAGAAILVLLGMGARRQAGTWNSSVTLFEHALAVTRDNYVAHDNLAIALSLQGRTREALLHALQAQRLHPDREPRRLVELGRALLGQRLYAEAEEVLGVAARLRPADVQIRQLLSTARTGAGAPSPPNPTPVPRAPAR
jgi:hypothetical protein